MMKRPSHTQAGIALPVTLIILVVMFISSIYLLKSSNTTTLTASNLAYDSAQSRAVDYGLHQGFQWLAATARTQKGLLDVNSTGGGYNATYDTTLSVRTPRFWNGSRTVLLGTQRIEYVIHRMCNLPLAFNHKDKSCVRPATTCRPRAPRWGPATASRCRPRATRRYRAYII